MRARLARKLEDREFPKSSSFFPESVAKLRGFPSAAALLHAQRVRQTAFGLPGSQDLWPVLGGIGALSLSLLSLSGQAVFVEDPR
jgi:hypothetical protein